MGFSKDFIWGVASASAQIEGAYQEGGKCLSIWDIADGSIKNNDDCHTTCDQYHRYQEDIALMKKMGVKSYRFSISWCRIMTEDNHVNPEGIAYYRSLIQELKKNDMIPMITLYHWDLPVWIQKLGGWASEKIVNLFCDYTKACVEAFSDEVVYWMTFNEPLCFLFLGYAWGSHAPFYKDSENMDQIVRNMLLAHGKAVQVMRQNGKQKLKIGIVMAAYSYVPDSDSPEDLRYAEEMTFETEFGRNCNNLYMDPIVLRKSCGILEGKLSEADFDIISEPIDYIGINTYQPMNGRVPRRDGGSYVCEKRTMMDWAIDGRCMYWVIRQYYERYHLPILITENGMANPDEVSADGHVHDEIRRDFMEEYLKELKHAVEEGYPVLGYLHWSVMDNFEWAEGFGPRFGLIHVDYETQKRTIKDSAYYYQKVMESNGEIL